MTEQNRNIESILNSYLKIDKPGYALLIKGSWGCGKTHFIKEWLKPLVEEKSKRTVNIRLKPIYVTLYGLSSSKQIDEEVKRAISPILHGKWMKKVEKVATLSASVALRYNLNATNQKDADTQVVCSIDPKALFESDEKSVPGKRLIVFDDLERCKMPMKEVMGYINYFVEHAGCHVVVVGDDDKIPEKDEEYQAIKEKTIGRELQLEPEIDEALNSFITIIGSKAKVLKEKKNLIQFCFNIANRKNLRILRQSLEDYCFFIDQLDESVKTSEFFDDLKLYLLANFIAVYAEYKSGVKEFEDYTGNLMKETRAKKDSDKEKVVPLTLHNIVAKYERPGLLRGHFVMAHGYVGCVMKYLREGKIDKDFINSEVSRNMLSPWELIGNYSELSNEEFKKNVAHTVGYLENNEFKKVDFLIKACCNMLVLINRKIVTTYTIENVVEWCKKGLEGKFFINLSSYDELYHEKEHVYRTLGYYGSEELQDEIKALTKGIEEAFKNAAKTTKDVMTLLLDNISDNRIDHFIKIYNYSLPDHSTPYSQSAIFSLVNPEMFVTNFVKLQNSSKSKFVSMIRSHYHEALDISHLGAFVKYYKDDLNTLPTIVELLEKEAEGHSLIDKYNILQLAECLKESCKKIKDTKQTFD